MPTYTDLAELEETVTVASLDLGDAERWRPLPTLRWRAWSGRQEDSEP